MSICEWIKINSDANSVSICKNMHFISNIEQWEHFSEKEVKNPSPNRCKMDLAADFLMLINENNYERKEWRQ